MIARVVGRLLNLPALLRYLREHRADRSVWDPAEDLELQLYGAIFGNNFLHYGYFRDIPASADEISLADVSRAMDDYASLLVERVTVEAVATHLEHIVRGEVHRHVLPKLCALQFTCEQALGSGVTTSLALDTHGKALSFALLALPIEPLENR